MISVQARRNVRVETNLHPAVYRALVATVVWMLSALWLLFGHGGPYLGLQLAVSTFFCVMFVAVPLWLRRLSGAAPSDASRRSFREWASNEFDTAYGPVEGRDAAVMVLLAPVAITLGITGVSTVAFLAARGLL